MADNLDPKEIRQYLERNTLVVQQACQERDEAVFGMKKLTSVLQTTRTNLHSCKEKSDMYELLLLRDGSHIKKLKQLVTEKEKEILKLRNAVKDSEGDIDDDIETDAAELEPDTAESDDENSGEASAEKVVVYGVAHEIHDQLLRDYIQLKKELHNLLEKQKINPMEYLENEEKKILIIQLETSNNELKKKLRKLEKELEEMIDTIKSEPSSSKSKVIDLSQQLKALHEKYRSQEILFHCMEDKCHDLAHKLLRLKQSRKDEVKSTDSKEATPSTTDIKADLPTDFPIDQQLKDLQFSNSVLSTSLNKSQQQNQVLTEKLKSAEVKSQINEQRYTELLRTLRKENKPDIATKCEKCSDNEKQIQEFKVKNEEQNNVKAHLNAQLSVYQEDYKQSRQEITNIKKRHEFEDDQWRTNYLKLSSELERMKKSLEFQYEVNRRLTAEAKRKTSQSVPEPYQSSRPDSGSNRGYVGLVDVCDQVASPSTHMHHNTLSSGFQDMPATLECPRCKREFPKSQQRELEVHVQRCLDD